MNATQAKTPGRRKAPVKPASKKTEVLQAKIPRSDFAIYQKFAGEFGLDPEIVMESGIFGALESLHDDTFSNLAYYDEMPPMDDVVPVLLSFTPDAAALIEVAARLLSRPSAWLLTHLLRDDAHLLAGQIEEAETESRSGARGDLEDWAKHAMAWDFEARLGRMFKRTQGFDAWQWLNLQRYRPGAATQAEGGAK